MMGKTTCAWGLSGGSALPFRALSNGCARRGRGVFSCLKPIFRGMQDLSSIEEGSARGLVCFLSCLFYFYDCLVARCLLFSLVPLEAWFYVTYSAFTLSVRFRHDLCGFPYVPAHDDLVKFTVHFLFAWHERAWLCSA